MGMSDNSFAMYHGNTLQLHNLILYFYRLGLRIARRPVSWIIGSTVIVLISLIGLCFFHQEKNPVRLWVPQNSDFVHDTEWMFQHFEHGLRMENMIITADNVLEPENLAMVFTFISIILYNKDTLYS